MRRWTRDWRRDLNGRGGNKRIEKRRSRSRERNGIFRLGRRGGRERSGRGGEGYSDGCSGENIIVGVSRGRGKVSEWV